MSRAEFSVVMYCRMPPLFASHASAKSAFHCSRSAVHPSDPRGSGGMPKR